MLLRRAPPILVKRGQSPRMARRVFTTGLTTSRHNVVFLTHTPRVGLVEDISSLALRDVARKTARSSAKYPRETLH
jgi:hypothetical protein